MSATHIVQIGAHECPIRIVRSSTQRLACMREWLETTMAYTALPADAPPLQCMAAMADVEMAGAAAFLRLLPKGHALREAYDANAYQSDDEPWRRMGADLIERLEGEGVGVGAVLDAINAMITAGGASPTAEQVEDARGNSDATPS